MTNPGDQITTVPPPSYSEPPDTLPETDPPVPPWAAKLFSALSEAAARYDAAAARFDEAMHELKGAARDYRSLEKRIEALEAKAAE